MRSRLLLVCLMVGAVLSLAVECQAPPTATASNKLQWDIPAQDLPTAQGYAYKYYLDGSATGNQFSGVLCSGTSATFTCQVLFPPVTQGTHNIRISASNAAGEGALSDPFAFAFVGKPGKPVNLSIQP